MAPPDNALFGALTWPKLPALATNPNAKIWPIFEPQPCKLGSICRTAAFKHMAAHGFANTALGTTVIGWWTASYQTHVLQTDDPAFVETMAMNWLDGDHQKSKSRNDGERFEEALYPKCMHPIAACAAR
jgi:hypothetical protein